MIKQTIKYEDYNGVEKVTEAYFALNKVELTEMEMTTEGGLSDYYQKIVATKDAKELARIFKELIVKSYGIKSADGERFIKRDPKDGHLLAEEFIDSAAFEAFYIELLTDEEKAATFFKGIVPKYDKAVPAPEAK